VVEGDFVQKWMGEEGKTIDEIINKAYHLSSLA
jgi:hypothetical protein